MAIAKLLGRSILALTIAAVPVATGSFGITGAALAKDGNGNSGGGGNNGNGGGNGHGGGRGGDNHGKSGEAHSGKSSKGKSADHTPTLKSLFTFGKKSETATKTEKTPKTATAKATSAEKAATAGLSSLNRNYHAYLNSNDPRMAAVSAYAIAYAEFEAENGTDVIPTDPALSDEALREALAGFTKDGVVTDDALEDAKEILGVGPAVGKIDQIRDTLPETTAEETTTTTTTTTTTIEVETAN